MVSFVAVVATSVTVIAARVEIGESTPGSANNFVVEDGWIVDNVKCQTVGQGMKVELSGKKPDGSTFHGVVTYFVAGGATSSDCGAKETAVKAKLRAEGAYISTPSTPPPGTPSPGSCERAILTWIDCGEAGVWQILQLVLDIMTAGVGILALIGLVISGMQWMTARDKEDQIIKAKSRIFNIVIGVLVWVLMWLVLNWLIPGFTTQAP